jgi:hypothetical protein
MRTSRSSTPEDADVVRLEAGLQLGLDAALQLGALAADQGGGVVVGDAVAHRGADLRAQPDRHVRRADVLVQLGGLGADDLVEDGDVDADVEALAGAGVDVVAGVVASVISCWRTSYWVTCWMTGRTMWNPRPVHDPGPRRTR